MKGFGLLDLLIEFIVVSVNPSGMIVSFSSIATKAHLSMRQFFRVSFIM